MEENNKKLDETNFIDVYGKENYHKLLHLHLLSITPVLRLNQ